MSFSALLARLVAPAPRTSGASKPGEPAQPPAGPSRLRWWVGSAVVLALGVAAVGLRPSPMRDAAGLDALYRKWGVPVPPDGCRRASEWGLLTPIATDAAALASLPEGKSAEAWYLLARAKFAHSQPAADELRQAVQCAQFSAAEELLGRVLAIESDQRPEQAVALREQSAARFSRALAADPTFALARLHRAAVLLKVPGRLEGAVADLRAVAAVEPGNGQALALLGFALERQAAAELKVAEALTQNNDPVAEQKQALARQLTADSRQASCRAVELGVADAAPRCQREGP